MVRDDPLVRTPPLSGMFVGVVLLAALLMAIASLQGVPRFGDIAFEHRIPAPTPTAGTQTPGAGETGLLDSPILGVIVVVIELVIALGFLLLLGWLFWRMARALWIARPMSREAGSAVEVGEASATGEEAVDAGTIRTAAASAQEEIDAHRDPGDAIVAAWVQLEEASARAGRARVPSETPGEFALRILRRRPGLDGELETLLGLYESVRFGGERADEAARATARRCLATIEEAWR
ncbi:MULTISPECIES: DUF4129 domain-containing protein [unclassified Microbacterium]|uniref:DUF4129 domain-containing protein n=1 Tax=unclassified Microbacterium TaxID=2609290 RepID=UPI001E3D1F2F|nr:DUF4129 domain-containing protein [Microbacterium sp. Au-Mic1]MCE4024486.1 DUF4129 domain-containing protein [Microbacterium sp. Au-Mic1]